MIAGRARMRRTRRPIRIQEIEVGTPACLCIDMDPTWRAAIPIEEAATPKGLFLPRRETMIAR
jgi:hypothetical protein